MSRRMTYAVIRIGGKQFRVQQGDKIQVVRQQGTVNPEVLYYSDEDKVLVGNPFIPGLNVSTKVIEEKLSQKIRVARFKSKSRYRKVKGHRQLVSILEIENISLNGKNQDIYDKDRSVALVEDKSFKSKGKENVIKVK